MGTFVGVGAPWVRADTPIPVDRGLTLPLPTPAVFKDERAVMWTTTCGDDITPDTVRLTPQIKLIHK